MATVLHTSVLELQATSPRMVTVQQPPYTNVDFDNVNGGHKPSDNADVTQSALIAGVTITGGGVTMSAGGSLKGGKTTYGSGTGVFYGYHSGAYKLDVGSPTNYFRFDGSAVSFIGGMTGASTIAITGSADFDGATSTAQGNAAIRANSSLGSKNGVVAYSNQSGGGAFYGLTTHASGFGVFGQASGGGTGVSGSGGTGVGVSAAATSGTGLQVAATTGIGLDYIGGKIQIATGMFPASGSVTPSFTNKPGAGTTVRWLEAYYGATRGVIPWVQY